MATTVRSKSLSQLNSGKFQWIYLGVFALVIGLLGGSSRPDAVQIAALRPLAALLLIPALCCISIEWLRRVRTPALFLAFLFAWMVVQIVPLPTAIWHSLPDRELVVGLDELSDLQNVWRPISLVPTRGVNALFSLVVPIAALLAAASFRLASRDLFVLIAGLGVADALLAFAQLFLGAHTSLYFYSVTNRGFAVGLFANENHSAVFSGIAMLAAVRLFVSVDTHRENAWLRMFGGVAFFFVFLAALVSGSRAGLVVGLLALISSILLTYFETSGPGIAVRNPSQSNRAQPSAGFFARLFVKLLQDPKKLGVIFISAIIGFAAIFVLTGRAAGLEQALNQSAFEGLRWKLAPVLQAMAMKHWLVGTGFGSFEEVYHIYEPTGLLLSSYVNQAHNDWLQLVIEGGAPAILLLLSFLVWAMSRVVAAAKGEMRPIAAYIFWGTVFLIIMVASIPDYPLRTPMFQAVGVWLVMALVSESDGRAKPRRVQ